LKSVETLNIPEGTDISVIVVENNSESSSEELISKLAAESRFSIKYYLETKQGISFARNRAVKESGFVDFCCFVDDDQEVDAFWLSELLRCQKEFNADGCWGVNPPVFAQKVKAYVRKFHEPEYYNYGDEVIQAYTNCLLLRKSCLQTMDGPFDLRLNFTGGEDVFLTTSLIRKGFSIRFTPTARAFEIIPEERTTLAYILRRTRRTINTKYIVAEYLSGINKRAFVFRKMMLRFLKGIVILIPRFLAGGQNKIDGLLKINEAIGGLLFVFGKKNKFYK